MFDFLLLFFTSFDPAGKIVVFPNGQRGFQCFGVAFNLDIKSLSRKETPFRFRGQQQRVNAVVRD